MMISSVVPVDGDRLRTFRHRQALSQEELAERAHISRSTVNKLEAGGQSARPRTVGQLARALKVKPAELILEQT